MWSSGQEFVAGHHLVAYNPNGSVNEDFKFTANVASGANQATVLVADSSYGTVFAGRPTPDASDPDLDLSPLGGAVCWVEGAPPDCIAWGNFAGPLPAHTPALVVGNPASPAGVPAAMALRRTNRAQLRRRRQWWCWWDHRWGQPESWPPANDPLWQATTGDSRPHPDLPLPLQRGGVELPVSRRPQAIPVLPLAAHRQEARVRQARLRGARPRRERQPGLLPRLLRVQGAAARLNRLILSRVSRTAPSRTPSRQRRL